MSRFSRPDHFISERLGIAMIELVMRHPYSMLMATAADELVSRDGGAVKATSLLERLCAGEGRAAAELFDRYAKDINRLVWRLLGPDSEHNDIVQQIFVEAMAGIQRVRDEASLGGWLRGIAINTVRTELRLRKRRRFFFARDGDTYVARASTDETVDARLRHVYDLLSRLSVDDRQAFALRYIAGNTLEEAAALLGCSLATMKRRLKRAEDKVRAWTARDADLGELMRESS